jgi:hypothetical protein
MSQIFHPSTNTISKLSIFGAVFFLAGSLWMLVQINRSAYMTETFVPRNQPVPFSHKHHVSGLGIDCRHCHTSVEVSAYAGVPPTKTCINCHSQIWKDSSMLEPVRASFQADASLSWTRVHDLPDFVYFDHSIHVNKGVGCATCHGRVDQMPVMWKVNTLQMEWCLECHRNPAPTLRPRQEVFNMSWEPPADQPDLGERLMEEYGVRRATDCSVCHR